MSTNQLQTNKKPLNLNPQLQEHAQQTENNIDQNIYWLHRNDLFYYPKKNSCNLAKERCVVFES
jgi:hypothetical protein